MSAQTATAQPSRARESALAPLFTPTGIAVIGASRTPGKLGAVMAQSLAPFEGPVALVNSRDPGDGFFASVREAVDAGVGPIDLAVLCVPSSTCADAVRDAAAAGVRAALVCASGFGEAGPAGAARERAMLSAAAQTGVRLLGPNTSGFFSPAHRLFASFVPGVTSLQPGSVGVVAASGGMNHAVAFLLAEAGHGVSLAVGLGNAIDVSTPDVLDHLADDPDTKAVALHLESVADGPRLLQSVARVAKHKPVVALVVGRSDVGEFASSHTGALATSWKTTRAVLRQAGAVLVDSERELIDAVSGLAAIRLPPSPNPGVGIVTAQAGPGLLILDSLRTAGVRVPTLTDSTLERLSELLPPVTYQANPVDTGRPGDSFGSVLAAVTADDGVDLLAGYALAEAGAVDLADAVSSPHPAGSGPSTPMVFAVGGHPSEADPVRQALRSHGMPSPTSPTGLATAVRAIVEDAQAVYRRSSQQAQGTMGISTTISVRDEYDEDEAKALLDRLGIASPPRRACGSADEAREAFASLRAPLAVKLLDASVLHKTDIGGVHLGVRTLQDLDEALASLVAAGARRFLVEEMAPAGVDLLVGARRDPVFGPVVVLAAGGTAAEALADASIRAVPLSAAEASGMPDDLAFRPLLEGWRGGPAVDRGELARVVLAVGALLEDHPEISDIDINPLRLTGQGLVALDAVITTVPTADREQ